VLAVKAVGALARIFKRLPGDFKHQALLWIESFCFPWRDAEELSVKLIEVLEKTASPRAHFARCGRSRIVDGLDIEAIRRNLGDGLTTLDEKFPEAVRGVNATWKTTADPDDCNRFWTRGRLYRLVLRTCER
jgi:hypothetical protein